MSVRAATCDNGGMSETPASPITALAAGAAQVHELFRAYVDAGFTEDQAMQLICTTLAAGARPQGEAS